MGRHREKCCFEKMIEMPHHLDGYTLRAFRGPDERIDALSRYGEKANIGKYVARGRAAPFPLSGRMPIQRSSSSLVRDRQDIRQMDLESITAWN
jgi:hypothetical protein